MDYKEAAKRLGISVGTVYNWVKSGKLEASYNETGEMDVSLDSVNQILNKRDVESNLVKAEWVISKNIKNQEKAILQEIHSLCKKVVSGYADEQASVIQYAGEIAKRYNRLQELQAAAKIVSSVVYENMEPFEELE